jgi:hypothetical protein
LSVLLSCSTRELGRSFPRRSSFLLACSRAASAIVRLALRAGWAWNWNTPAASARGLRQHGLGTIHVPPPRPRFLRAAAPRRQGAGLAPGRTRPTARELDVRQIDTLCISFRDHDTQRAAAVLKSLVSDAGGAGWLIVDDLVGTGATSRTVREMLPKARFATAKPAGGPLVDTFITEVSQDTWILFPWDTEPQYAQPIAGRARI